MGHLKISLASIACFAQCHLACIHSSGMFRTDLVVVIFPREKEGHCCKLSWRKSSAVTGINPCARSCQDQLRLHQPPGALRALSWQHHEALLLRVIWVLPTKSRDVPSRASATRPIPASSRGGSTSLPLALHGKGPGQHGRAKHAPLRSPRFRPFALASNSLPLDSGCLWQHGPRGPHGPKPKPHVSLAGPSPAMPKHGAR